MTVSFSAKFNSITSIANICADAVDLPPPNLVNDYLPPATQYLFSLLLVQMRLDERFHRRNSWGESRVDWSCGPIVRSGGMEREWDLVFE